MNFERELNDMQKRANNVMINIDNLTECLMNLDERDPNFVLEASDIKYKLMIAEEVLFRLLLETVEFDTKVRNEDNEINEYIRQMSSKNN